MSREKKFVKKSFLIHQFEKEEKFLSDMREKGWKFVALHKGIPTKYEFEACEPEKYSYCLDYIKIEEDTEDYHQLYKDAGWEEVIAWSGFNATWYYFCKKCKMNEKETIFSDSISKLGLLNKILTTYGLFFIILLLPDINAISFTIRLLRERDYSFLLYLIAPISVLCLLAMILFGYTEIRIFMMKRRLEARVTEKI